MSCALEFTVEAPKTEVIFQHLSSQELSLTLSQALQRGTNSLYAPAAFAGVDFEVLASHLEREFLKIILGWDF